MKKLKIPKVLNIISICIYLLVTVYISVALIQFTSGELTEGSGIVIIFFMYIVVIECIIVMLLNLIGVIILNINRYRYDDDYKSQATKLTIWMIFTIIVSIATFPLQLIIIS